MVVTAGVASIKGTYAGEVQLSDQQEPNSFLMTASGAGGPGTVSTEVRVALADAGDGSTTLTYDADAVVGGVIAGVGQRMLVGVSKKMAGEFFRSVDDVLTGKAVAGWRRRGRRGRNPNVFVAPGHRVGSRHWLSPRVSGLWRASSGRPSRSRRRRGRRPARAQAALMRALVAAAVQVAPSSGPADGGVDGRRTATSGGAGARLRRGDRGRTRRPAGIDHHRLHARHLAGGAVGSGVGDPGTGPRSVHGARVGVGHPSGRRQLRARSTAWHRAQRRRGGRPVGRGARGLPQDAPVRRRAPTAAAG